MPFWFEGKRIQRAEAGITALREHVDSLVIFHNNSLFECEARKRSFAVLLRDANEVLSLLVKGLAGPAAARGMADITCDAVKSFLAGSAWDSGAKFTVITGDTIDGEPVVFREEFPDRSYPGEEDFIIDEEEFRSIYPCAFDDSDGNPVIHSPDVLKASAADIQALAVTGEPWSKLFKQFDHCDHVTIEHIFEQCGFEAALHSLKAVKGHDKAVRLFACYCARLSLWHGEIHHPEEKTIFLQAIETAEQFAHGHATEEDLKAAWTAANEAGCVYAAPAQKEAWSAAQACACRAVSVAHQVVSPLEENIMRKMENSLIKQVSMDMVHAAREAGVKVVRQAVKVAFLKMCRGLPQQLHHKAQIIPFRNKRPEADSEE